MSTFKCAQCMLLTQLSQHNPEPSLSASVNVLITTLVFSSEGQTVLDAKLGRESAPAWPTGKQRPRGAGKKDSLAGGGLGQQP